MEDREKNLQFEINPTNGEEAYKDIIDIQYFNEVVVGAYNKGIVEEELPADIYTARSFIPVDWSFERFQLYCSRNTAF